MFSGGLDSRLALKIMQKQKYDITAVFFKLPFGTGCCNENCSFNFSQIHGVKLIIFDCTKGKLLAEYLKIIEKPRYKRGAGINPCIDCRIFMLRKTKEFADKNKTEIIITGEVLGERPLSQTKNALKLIEKEAGLESRILRPLTDLYGITGRRREKQIELAKKFKINYPTPAGGCLLCEKNLKKRLKFLLERGLNEKEINLIGIGRHFVIDNCWIVIGRNEKENNIIESFDKKKVIIPAFIGASALILDSCKKETKEKVKELIRAYSKQGSLEERNKFEKFKL